MKLNYFLTLTLITLIQGKLNAQWSIDPTVNTDVFTTGFHFNLVQKSDEQGGTIMVCDGYVSGSTTGGDIYAQHIDATGKKLWGTNGIKVCDYIENQSRPDVVPDGNGNYIITWEDYRNGIRADIYAQKIDESGNKLWNINGALICDAANEQSYPKICSDGIGGAIIAWNDYRNEFNLVPKGDIYAQKINADGILQWTINGNVFCALEAEQRYVRIKSFGIGEAIICWEDYRNGLSNNSSFDLYAQRIGTDGSYIWQLNGVAVCTAPNYQKNHSIECNGTQDIFITWEDCRNNPDNSQNGIYAQLINSSGAIQWGNFGKGIINLFDSKQTLPQMALDAYGNIVVTWQDGRNYTNTGYDIYAQCIKRDGSFLWANNGIEIAAIPGNQENPMIVSDNVGGTIIAWVDDVEGVVDLYAQRINNNGSILWALGGYAVSSALKTQYQPTLISDYESGAIVAWTDTRFDNNGDFYCQRIYSNGKLTKPSVGINSIELRPLAIFPNPAHNILNFESPIEIQTIKISNTMGQIIIAEKVISNTLDISYLANGVYIIECMDINGTLTRTKFIKE